MEPHKKSPANARLFEFLAVWTGLEPATPCVTGMYSNQLNYQTVFLFFSDWECKNKILFDILQIFYKFFSQSLKVPIFVT